MGTNFSSQHVVNTPHHFQSRFQATSRMLAVECAAATQKHPWSTAATAPNILSNIKLTTPHLPPPFTCVAFVCSQPAVPPISARPDSSWRAVTRPPAPGSRPVRGTSAAGLMMSSSSGVGLSATQVSKVSIARQNSAPGRGRETSAGGAHQVRFLFIIWMFHLPGFRVQAGMCLTLCLECGRVV